MTTQEYWRKRALQREAQAFKLTGDELQREVRRYYEGAISEIQKEIALLYAQFATENGLTMQEARRLIRGKEFRRWRMSLREYIEASKADAKVLRELNTLAMRSRISRLEMLEARTLMVIADISEKLDEWLSAKLYRSYVDYHYGNLYDIGRQAGLITMPVAVDPKKIADVIKTPWSGKNYSARIWNNCAALSKVLRQSVKQAVHRGTSIQKLSREIASKMDAAYSNAERLVRTELNYVQNRAAADAIAAADFGEYQFIAVLDARTTPICQSLDGEHFPIAEMEQGENAPPMHVRCRSTIVAYDGEPTGKRSARDSEGKRIKIPAEMDYHDWKAVYIDKTQTLEQWQSSHKPKERTESDIRADYDAIRKKINVAEEYYRQVWEKPSKYPPNEFHKAKNRLHDAKVDLNLLRIEAARRNIILASRLGEVYNTEEVAAVVSYVNKASENYRVLWNLSEGEMKVLNKIWDTRPIEDPKRYRSHYLSGQGLNIELYADTVINPRKYNRPAYTDTFHEIGHLIDHWMGKMQLQFNCYYSIEFENGIFGDTLRQEGEAYIKATLKRLKQEAVAAGRSAKSIKKADAYKAIEAELKSFEHREIAEVSDIWSGLTQCKACDHWWHEKTYWKDAALLPKEAFAEMWQATLTNPESLAMIKRYFPKSYEVFERMVTNFLEEF